MIMESMKVFRTENSRISYSFREEGKGRVTKIKMREDELVEGIF